MNDRTMLEPVKKDHCNFTYKAPSDMEYCTDLHVTKVDFGSVSVWRVISIIERLRFLFTGEMSLVIHGSGMPPVALHTGDWYARTRLY